MTSKNRPDVSGADKTSLNAPLPLDRRGFLRRGSGLAVGALIAKTLADGRLELRAARAADDDEAKKPATPVNLAVIGLGVQGRNLLTSLTHLEGATIKAVCDLYEPLQRRATEMTKGATAHTDYRKILSDKSVQAVFIATPTHQHKDIAIAALQAGKHVYCEAPLAAKIEDARAIAKEALKHPKLVFQPGLQRRANTLDQSVRGFVKAGVLNTLVAGSGSYAIKDSWRKHAADAERAKERNWRLDPDKSGGLLGEVGIHQIDWATWYIDTMPKYLRGGAVTRLWKDGRDIADTVRLEVVYPGGMVFNYNATLASSFGGTTEQIQGAMATVMMRGNKAWMIKETDAPALGWEVYASKEAVGDDSGIALVANATKLLDEGKDPSEAAGEYAQGALHYGCETFLEVIRGNAKATFGAQEGFNATVIAIKANQAATTNKTIEVKKEWFDLG